MSKIKIGHGEGSTEFGPGVLIRLDVNQVAGGIDHWLHAKGFVVCGPRTISRDGDEGMRVYVDPVGFVIHKGTKYSGRGPGYE